MIIFPNILDPLIRTKTEDVLVTEAAVVVVVVVVVAVVVVVVVVCMI